MSRVFQVKPKQVFEKVELKGHLLTPENIEAEIALL